MSTPVDQEANDDENQCGRPCDPSEACQECEDYWERMRSEGYWDQERHRWTDKGWREITKSI